MVQIYQSCPVNPGKVSANTQQPQVVNLNYANQDFWSMKTRLIKFCQERFGPGGTVLPNTFNDFVESDLAIMMIENFAFLADLLSFKIDQYANEQGIGTVTQLDNAFRIAQNVGFKPQPPIAASSMWTATIPGTTNSDVEILTPVPINLVSNNTPLIIELFQADANNEPIFNSPIIIPAGQVINSSVIGLEGTTITTSFTGNGNPSQTITLTNNPVIFDSIQVTVDGKTWQEVDSFTDSQPRPEYMVTFDSTWTAYVIFGNNRAGLIPSQGSQIVVTYRKGGGTAGNIVTNYANSQLMVSVPGLANSIPVTFINYTAGSNGYNGDGIEDIRRKLPQWIMTQERVVSGSDYKAFADQFASPYHGTIGKSIAVLRNQGCAGNIIDLYILANGTVNGISDLEPANTQLKNDLITALNNVKMLTDFVCVKDGVVVYVEISITATLNQLYKKYQNEVQQNIQNIVAQFFSINNWDYGQTLKSIDLIKALASVQQIDDVTVTFYLQDNYNSTNPTFNNTVLTEVDVDFYEIIRPSINVPINIIFI